MRGGYTKFRVSRHDLLLRDAACAGADRVLRANSIQFSQPEGAIQDVAQVHEVLMEQARQAGPRALADGHLSQEGWEQAASQLDRAAFWFNSWEFLRSFAPRAIREYTLNKGAESLEAVCGD